MPMPRWSTNTWMLVCLGCVILLIAGDITRRAVHPAPETPPKPPPGMKLDTNGRPITWEPQIGKEARDFALPDETGKIHHLSDFKGKGNVVLTFFCGCNACADMAKQLAETYRRNPKKVVPTVSVFTSHWDPAGTPGWVNRTNAHFNYIYSRVDPALVDIYRGTPCPKVYILDKNLKIRYISVPSNALSSNQPTLEEVTHVLGIKYQPPPGGSPRFNSTAPTARSTRAAATMD
jgi:AhpC/TSA family